MRKGFALPYSLLLLITLALLFEAVFLRVLQSLRFAQYDQAQVQARQLCRMGCELGYALYQKQGPDWLEKLGRGRRLDNTQFGPHFSSQRLGGSFVLEVLDRSQLSEDPFPEGGTYKVLQCRATVGRRSSQTSMTLKLTSPFVNYLSVTTRSVVSSEMDGPIFVNSSPPGQPGDCQLVHQFQLPLSGGQNHFSQTTTRFGGSIEAIGDIYVQNYSAVGGAFAQGPIALNGRIAGGTVLQNLDLTAVNNTSPQGGEVVVTRPSTFRPHREHAVQVPAMSDLLDVYRTREGDSNVVNVRIDSARYPEGVLVELTGGKAFVSPARSKPVGRLFDRGLYLDFRLARPAGSSEGAIPSGSDAAAWQANDWADSHTDVLRALQESAYPGRGDQLSRAEMDWDDPSFANAPLPSVLTGNFEETLTRTGFSLAPGTGDYLEVKRLVRGPSPVPVAIDPGPNWTVLRLIAQDCQVDSADPTPRKIAPPVYVRGVVKGRLALVYDVAEESLDPLSEDPEQEKLSMFVLAEHEAADDVPPAQQLSGPGQPGIPGGIHLADGRTQPAAETTGPFSDDYCLLLCRGSVAVAGANHFGCSWLVDAAGQRVDYRARLRDLDLAYQTAFGANFRIESKGDQISSEAMLQAVAVGSICDYHRVTSDYRVATTYQQDPHGRLLLPGSFAMGSWSQTFSGPLPAGVDPNVMPNLARYFRSIYAWRFPLWRIDGGLSATDFRVGSKLLKANFDYRWRSKTESELSEQIKLPVGPLVLQEP